MGLSGRALSLGDRVLVVGRTHPWRGYAGTITDTFGRAALEWVVRLDNGFEPACAASDLRRTDEVG